MVTSRPNAPTFATSSGLNRGKSCAAALRRSGRLPAMLPETSSITISRIGWGLLSNTVIGWGLPSSRTSKWFCARFVTSRPSLSVTVTNTRTASRPPRKVGCCPAAPSTPRAQAARVAPVRIRFMETTLSSAGRHRTSSHNTQPGVEWRDHERRLDRRTFIGTVGAALLAARRAECRLDSPPGGAALHRAHRARQGLRRHARQGGGDRLHRGRVRRATSTARRSRCGRR